MLERLLLLVHISRSNLIARRYFVVNGFDGALTMLGLLMGFYMSNNQALPVIISACLGTAIALAVSGISSAYISESAEKKQELKNLEDAMVSDLQSSAHAQAARLMPLLIALVNGLAPLLFALIIMSPLFLAQTRPELVLHPVKSAALVAFVLIFLLGVFIGKISGTQWIWSGVRALMIALLTSFIIYLVNIL